MALCVNYTKTTVFKSDNGESITQDKTYPNAYARIGEILGGKYCITVIVNIYESKPVIVIDEDGTETESNTKVDELFFNFTPDVGDNSDNFIKQGYEFLKTTEAFANATDC